MRLKQLTIKNFRGYQNEQTLDIDGDITAIVGKNDAGKSTLLEALEIFFENSTPTIEDLSVSCGDDREIVISCVFDGLPDSISVDSTADTTLETEYMLNKDGFLEVVKVYKCTKSTVAKEPDIYIKAVHPTAERYNDLLTLKIDGLRTRSKELGVKSGDDRVSNVIRKAIWANSEDLKLEESLLSYNDLEEKFQSVYKNLEGQFPHFFIFKVDRQTTDADSEAKDPIQLAVKEAKKQFDTEIIALEDKIKKSVQEVTERALEKLKEIDANLADQLVPDFKKRPTWTFDFKISDQRGIPINKRGSGTRRLVLLNFFRAEAERKSGSEEANIVYAIEEPETSQHPNNQKLIVDSLRDLASDNKRQVVITTHSSELLEYLPSDSVRFVSSENGSPEVVNGEDGLFAAGDSLGVLSNQKFGSARAVVIVEGESDEVFLTHAANQLFTDGHIASSLETAKVLILPAGSCDNVPFWIQKHRLDSLGLPYAVILDSDRTNAADPTTKNEQFCLDLTAQGVLGICLKKRTIENYIDPALTNTNFGEYDDAKNIISQANNVRGSRVCSTYWTQMDSASIIARSEYLDGGNTRCEIIEILQQLLTLPR